LLDRALAHRSWCAEQPGELSNERLEFLGDAVLGLVVADHVFSTFPDHGEGWLSRARASLVRASTLYSIALDLELGAVMRLGKGELLSGGRDKPSILADAVEAIIGATYVDGGMDEARALVLHLLGHRLDELAERVGPDADPSPNDHKSRLQERCAHDGGELPAYTWTESGPEHAKTFQVQVRIDGKAVATGTGRSKKQAEQAAAAIALALLEEQPHQPE
jgi:ribonuclease-3